MDSCNETFPDGISSSRAKLVYLYVASTGRATAAEIAGSLAMNKTTVFTILRTLRDGGLVRKTGTSYACTTA